MRGIVYLLVVVAAAASLLVVGMWMQESGQWPAGPSDGGMRAASGGGGASAGGGQGVGAGDGRADPLVFVVLAVGAGVANTVGSVHRFHPEASTALYVPAGNEPPHGWEHVELVELPAAVPDDAAVRGLWALHDAARRFGKAALVPPGAALTSRLDAVDYLLAAEGVAAACQGPALALVRSHPLQSELGEALATCLAPGAAGAAACLEQVTARHSSICRPFPFHTPDPSDPPRFVDSLRRGQPIRPAVPATPPAPPTTRPKATPRAKDAPRGSSSGGSGNSSGRPTIAIGVPVTTRRTRIADVSMVGEMPLVTTLVPSLAGTVEPDKFDYVVYVGIDQGDAVLDHQHGREALEREFNKAAQGKLALRIKSLSGTRDAPCWVWNALQRRAVREDGAEYFFQLSDDVRLVDAQWSSALAGALAKSPLGVNVGVAGPVQIGAEETVLHAFVHRTHEAIFENLFPADFKNWFSDEWISNVYSPTGTMLVGEVHVEHTAVSGQRFYEEPRPVRNMDALVSQGCAKVAKHTGRPASELCSAGVRAWWVSK